MQAHTLTFSSFYDKRCAIDWIKENVEPDDYDEKLTELKFYFLTGIDLNKRTTEKLLKAIPHKSYEAHDY